MPTLALERETQNYWALLKDASDPVKLALISLLLDAKSRFWWDGPDAVKDFYREELKRNNQ